MNRNSFIIRNDERAVFALRSIYEKYGYKPYKMNKFEEYEFYLQNKDFLVSDNIITFTDRDGRLMALKPDVTLSIIKNARDGEVKKVYYNENVYRVSNGSYKEIMQTGLECIGADADAQREVLLLAARSLEEISSKYILELSHMGVISELMDMSGVPRDRQKDALLHIGKKNAHELAALCETDRLPTLISCSGQPKDFISALTEAYNGKLSPSALELVDAVKYLEENGCLGRVRIDLSVLNDMNYYSGIVFKGFIDGISEGILSGGRYDKLMSKLGKSCGALGFAIYLDLLRCFDAENVSEGDNGAYLNIALPKGRLGEKVYDIFEKAGFPCPAIKDTGRKLIFENRELALRYFWVKPSDVAIYVERGAADIGVCGKDILLEYSPDVYELADLGIGRCKMAVAAKNGFFDDGASTLRVATKFSHIAKKYYDSKGRDIDVIHLNGSIEIAPILGLSDVIVDIVETGTTLKENDLSVFEEIVPISARFICNKSSYKFKTERIEKIASCIKNK